LGFFNGGGGDSPLTYAPGCGANTPLSSVTLMTNIIHDIIWSLLFQHLTKDRVRNCKQAAGANGRIFIPYEYIMLLHPKE